MSRALFIRVKSHATGHEFDVREDSHLLADGHVRHVKPKLFPPSRYPRPPKYRIPFPGQFQADLDAATDGVAEQETEDTTEENHG